MVTWHKAKHTKPDCTPCPNSFTVKYVSVHGTDLRVHKPICFAAATHQVSPRNQTRYLSVWLHLDDVMAKEELILPPAWVGSLCFSVVCKTVSVKLVHSVYLSKCISSDNKWRNRDCTLGSGAVAAAAAATGVSLNNRSRAMYCGYCTCNQSIRVMVRSKHERYHRSANW